MRKVVVGLMLALGVALLPMAAAQADPVSDEAAFVAKINQLRAGKGLPALQVNENLVAKARTWAAGMAAAGRIWHSTLSDGITADWKKLGENVGMGGSVDGLHDAFVASVHHYENLVDPAFSHVGIGIVMSGQTIFVAEMFMQLMPSKAPLLSTPITTPTTAPRVTTTAPRPTTTTAPRVTTTTAPKPPAPKPVTAAAAPIPDAPVATAAVPTAPVATPAEPPRAPSALLVSVLERLRSFDS
jgi:hypothetical protein